MNHRTQLGFYTKQLFWTATGVGPTASKINRPLSRHGRAPHVAWEKRLRDSPWT